MRGKKLTSTVVAVVAVVAVGAGGAYGLTQLGGGDDVAASDSSPEAPSDPATQIEETPTSDPTLEAAASAEVTPSPTKTPTETPTPTPTPEALMAGGDSGDDVRELQARLKQIDWYTPDITGEFDDVTTDAVARFQAKRELPDTGDVDQETWDRLVAMTREPTDDELHNRIVAGPPILQPGDSGDEVRELQARLKQIEWFVGEVTPNYGDVTREAVAGFQAKRGLPETGAVDQETWDRLAAMTREPTDDELHNREPEKDDEDEDEDTGSAAPHPDCATGRALCIDKSTQSMKWMVDGNVKMTVDVRFGSELTPTREGTFSVGWKSRHHVSSIYDTPMPYAMFFSRGQAIHYSPDFAQNGYNGASHGCVNVRDEGAIASLFDQVKVGDKVVVFWS